MNQMQRAEANKKLLYRLSIAVVALYLCSIFAVNIGGRAYVNFDIYSDAILAKYMAENHTLFPEGWHFGNQIYTVATPVLSGIMYFLTGDSYLALALASCVMTVVCVMSYLWCVKPFAQHKRIIPALVVFIGGTNIGYTAHGDMNGLQVFFTMASYYSCYLIGILVTLGVYCRLMKGIPVKKHIFPVVILLNFALGMQSLRELLVLNLPLCAAALAAVAGKHLNRQKLEKPIRSAGRFAGLVLVANIGGSLLTKLLSQIGIVNQNDILRGTHPGLLDNIRTSFRAMVDYIGVVPVTGMFDFLKLAGALFSMGIVAAAVCFALVDIMNRREKILGHCIGFFGISLFAVFLAGVLFIQLRPIYYFCWYLLVSFCVIYLLEVEWKDYRELLEGLKKLLVIGLLCVSFMNYMFTFVISFENMNETRNYYQEIADQLHADGIKYLYSDWRTERNMISTMSEDEIVYATMSFSNDPDDLWVSMGYLYMDAWFDAENVENAYVVLTDDSLLSLETEFSPEYRTALMSNLELVHEFPGMDVTIYLYRGTEKMFRDMIN